MTPSVPFQRDAFTWLAYLMLGYFAYLQASIGPVMVFLSRELELSHTLTGLHLSAFALGMIGAGALGGWSRCLPRPVRFWGGAAGIAFGAVSLCVSTAHVYTLGSILLMGFTGTFLLITIQAALADRYQRSRHVALTEANLVAILIVGLAPISIGGAESLGLGWRLGLLPVLALGAFLFFCCRGLPLPANPVRREASVGVSKRLPIGFWLFWVVLVTAGAVEAAMVFWGPRFLEAAAHLPAAQAASSMSLFFGGMLLGRTAASRLSRFVPAQHLLVAHLGFLVLALPVFLFGASYWVIAPGLFLVGLGVANLYPLIMSIAVGVDPFLTDLASARISLAAGVAMLCAPFLLGILADRVGVVQAFGTIVLLPPTALLLAALAVRVSSRTPVRSADAVFP